MELRCHLEGICICQDSTCHDFNSAETVIDTHGDFQLMNLEPFAVADCLPPWRDILVLRCPTICSFACPSICLSTHLSVQPQVHR